MTNNKEIWRTDPLADKILERNNKPGKEHDPIKPAHTTIKLNLKKEQNK